MREQHLKGAQMTLSNELIKQIQEVQDQLDSLKFGNVDFIIKTVKSPESVYGKVFVRRKKNNWLTEEQTPTLPDCQGCRHLYLYCGGRGYGTNCWNKWSTKRT